MEIFVHGDPDGRIVTGQLSARYAEVEVRYRAKKARKTKQLASKYLIIILILSYCC
jgi:hypothetical protein